ncbi:MAG: hypothetical protein HYZ26_11840 [Chloroflexi bacterium]|nr:hypothetical protein [Chloroflexota bacterium]
MRNGGHSNGYLVTGLLIGLALGLVYAWVLVPVELIDTSPQSLRADFQDDYRALVAAAFVASGDLGRARARLALLNDPDPARTLAMLAQRTLAEGGPADTARALGLLAAALGSGGLPPEATSHETPPPETPGAATAAATPSATLDAPASGTPDAGPTGRPTRTVTPTPTRTPTPTQGPPFQLQERAPVCDPNLDPALIQVFVFDAAGAPVPGVEVLVTWAGGQDTFFTGLKPEFGLGYADFQMSAGVVYTLQLAAGGDPVPNLSPSSDCPPAEDGRAVPGSWRLVFRQP